MNWRIASKSGLGITRRPRTLYGLRVAVPFKVKMRFPGFSSLALLRKGISVQKSRAKSEVSCQSLTAQLLWSLSKRRSEVSRQSLTAHPLWSGTKRKATNAARSRSTASCGRPLSSNVLEHSRVSQALPAPAWRRHQLPVDSHGRKR